MGLTKTQIKHILNNYKLKYTKLKKEINSKLNSLIKVILNDISPFLENIEEISKEIKNLKEKDNHKRKNMTKSNLIDNLLKRNDNSVLKKLM